MKVWLELFNALPNETWQDKSVSDLFDLLLRYKLLGKDIKPIDLFVLQSVRNGGKPMDALIEKGLEMVC